MIKKKNEPNFKFNLGDEAEDIITGFLGIIVNRSQWIHGCNTYGLQSKELKDGIPKERVWFDEPQLKIVIEKIIKEKRDTGGPCMAIPMINR